MPDSARLPLLSARFRDALTLAFDLHRPHERKGSRVPFFSHLMAVAALVLEDGHGEDDAIAALLHDALEDCADRISAEDLETLFGRHVRELVEACTDTHPEYKGGDKEPWRLRKERYIDRIAAGGHALHVSLADKVHNARSILRDLNDVGDEVWGRFKASTNETLWYYRSLVDAYRFAGETGFLVDELDGTVAEIERIAGWSAPLESRKYVARPQPQSTTHSR